MDLYYSKNLKTTRFSKIYMGRIKITQVKRSGYKLNRDYSDRFDTDFQHNKKTVREIAEVRSKKLRNIIAGYLTKLKKTRKN